MDNINYTVALEKGNLINKAIQIIDKLAENDLADMDGDVSTDDFDVEELKTLIIKAREIKGDRWWKLLKER